MTIAYISLNKNIKKSISKHANYNLNETFSLSSNLKKELFTPTGKIYSADSELIKTVGLGELKKKSYIVGKICIKSTVFGIVLLASKEVNAYDTQDTHILNASTSVLSYVLKDL